jgi:arylsulfatase A-like enzyme
VRGLERAGILDETLLVLTADHGGHERSHGSDSSEDMTVPLIMRGPGIKKSCNIEGPTSILDIAPTITRVLGLATPPGWQGRPLMEALL